MNERGRTVTTTRGRGTDVPDHLAMRWYRARRIAGRACLAWLAAWLGVVLPAALLGDATNLAAAVPAAVVFGTPAVYLLARWVAAPELPGARSAERSRRTEERVRSAAERAERQRQMEESKRVLHERDAATPGTEAWRRRRSRSRSLHVFEQTGVRWDPSMFQRARGPAQEAARDLMAVLVAQDRAEERAHHRFEMDRRLAEGPIATPRAAEVQMARWLSEHGFPDAKPTAEGSDAGVDIVATGLVSQVKLWKAKKVGRPALQQLVGARGTLKAAFFCLSGVGYSIPAMAYADENGVALFLFDHLGTVSPLNRAARELLGE
jgi:hypothetical protein